MIDGCGHVGSLPVRHACFAIPKVGVTKVIASVKGVEVSVCWIPRTQMLRALLVLYCCSAMVTEMAALGTHFTTSSHHVVSSMVIEMVAICSSTSSAVRGAAVRAATS